MRHPHPLPDTEILDRLGKSRVSRWTNPAFYFGPKKINDIVQQFVYRVLAQLGLPQAEQYRWQGGARGEAKS